MIKKTYILIAIAFFGITSTVNAGGNKVAICHTTSSVKNPTVLISVSENAVQAQLAQGSFLATLALDGSYFCESSVPTPQ